MKKVLIIGAGPAGLTAAYELLKTGEYDVTVLERSQEIGGISKTVRYRDNRMDIGGHRFFSKDDRVMQWWADMMPLQGAPAMDDRLLNREVPLAEGGPDPEKEDRVMLTRNRVSRIYYQHHFFDYPISLAEDHGLCHHHAGGLQLSGGLHPQAAQRQSGKFLHQFLRQEAILHVL